MSGTHPRFCIIALAAWGALSFGACGPKSVRMQHVSNEDAIRSNALGLEADRFLESKQYYPALLKYLDASRLHPRSVYVLNGLGLAYSQLQYRKEAIEAFERAIASDPRYPYPYNNLGSIYFVAGEKKKAEHYFKKAIALRPGAAVFHLNLGNLHLEKKELKQGIEAYRRALALDPGILARGLARALTSEVPTSSTADRHYLMARLYASLGHADLTVESLELAIRAGYSDVEAINSEPDFDPIRADSRFRTMIQAADRLRKQ